jgi:hypothetical protein
MEEKNKAENDYVFRANLPNDEATYRSGCRKNNP